jgi:hypothetical protein
VRCSSSGMSRAYNFSTIAQYARSTMGEMPPGC